MKIVRDRAEAKWLPSRFRYACFRLMAWLILRRSPPRERRGIVLVIDRDQSAIEQYSISLWILITASCYVIAALSPFTSPLVAALAAAPIAALLLETPMYIGAVVAPDRIGVKVQTVLMFAILIASTAYFAISGTWARYVAYAFMIVLAVNCVCAVIMWMLRASVADMERAYGVEG